MNQTPRVYISVLNWNGYEKTLKCLQSLEQLDYSNYKILVVDNASTDDSVVQIQRAYPETDLIRAESNLGYAGGNKLALCAALQDPEAELFWILNNDTAVQHNTLSVLVEAYLQHGEALYGSVPVTSISAQQSWIVQMQFWSFEGSRAVHHKVRQQRYDEYFDHTETRIQANVSGSSLVIPLSVVREHGFIHTDFFMYMEDADYCLRMRKLGIPSILVPASVVFHIGGGSRKGEHNKIKPVIIYYQTRNRIVFRRRHIGRSAFLATIIKHIVYALVWLFSALTSGPFALQCARYTFLGVRDALFNRMGKIHRPEDAFRKTA